jgi:hypothetical protein
LDVAVAPQKLSTTFSEVIVSPTLTNESFGYQYNPNLRAYPDQCDNGLQISTAPGRLTANYGYVTSRHDAPQQNGDLFSYTSAERFVSVKRTDQGLDMVLAINTQRAYNNAVPQKNALQLAHCWPHMLVAQDFTAAQLAATNLGDLDMLALRFDAVLRDSTMYAGSRDPSYTGHFLFHVKVRSLDGARQMWVGSVIYDYRFEAGTLSLASTPLLAHVDGQSKIQVVSLLGNTVPLQQVKSLMNRGNRVSFNINILPAIVQSIAALKWDANLSNYVFDHFNIGWEAPGLYNGKMEIYGFNIDARR